VALETLFPPIPSELILPLSGYLASQGRMSLAMVVIGATVGSLVGALACTGPMPPWGRSGYGGSPSGCPWSRWATWNAPWGWFDRHGGLAVLIGRVVPVVRSLVSVPAGVERMPLWRFVLYTIIGSGVYNLVLVGLGFVLGSRWKTVEHYSNYLNYAIYQVGSWLAPYTFSYAVLWRESYLLTGLSTCREPTSPAGHLISGRGSQGGLRYGGMAAAVAKHSTMGFLTTYRTRSYLPFRHS
jgi:membrane protein DedA with SNARE-associated domain